MKDFKRINRESVYKGAIIEFCKDQVITPEGNRVEWDYLIHKGAAAIIPVMDDGRIIMVRQWRNAIDKFSLENLSIIFMLSSCNIVLSEKGL